MKTKILNGILGLMLGIFTPAATFSALIFKTPIFEFLNIISRNSRTVAAIIMGVIYSSIIYFMDSDTTKDRRIKIIVFIFGYILGALILYFQINSIPLQIL